MRKVVATSALLVVAVSVSLVACDKAKAPNESTSADVERDLNLASSVQSQRTGIVSPIEQVSNGAPSGNDAGKRIGVETKKRAPSPAHSPTVAAVAVAPRTTQEQSATSTSAVEVSSAAVSAAATTVAEAPSPAPTMMVTDPIRNTTLSVAALGATDHMDPGAGTGNPHRPGLAALRGIWQRWSARPGAVIRGGNVGVDNCEAPRFGGGGILGATFGGTGAMRGPVGSSSGGVGVHAPEGLPAGVSAPGAPSVAAGANNPHFGGKGS